MNILPLDKQIEIIAALCEGVGQRAGSRLTGTDRKTVARLALSIGRGAAELHDRMMAGLRVHRIECDELWAYVGHKRNPQKGRPSRPSSELGDQYTYIAPGVVYASDHHLPPTEAALLRQPKLRATVMSRAAVTASATAGTKPFSSPLGLTLNHVANSAKPAATAAKCVRVKVMARLS